MVVKCKSCFKTRISSNFVDLVFKNLLFKLFVLLHCIIECELQVREVAYDIVMFFREYLCHILSLLLDEVDAFFLCDGADVLYELAVRFLN